MGNCCCDAESPCGSIEERSVLLKDDSKTSCAGERVVVGTRGPEDDDDMRQSRVVNTEEEQQRCQNNERDPKSTRGNGHLQKENIQQAKASPRAESATGEQHDGKEDAAADRRTLNQLQKDISTPDGQEGLATDVEPKTEKEDPTTVQEKVSGLVSPAPESAGPENLSHPETNTPTEDNNTASGSHAGSGLDAIGTEAKPSEEFTQNNEVLSEPNSGAASIPAVSQETNTAAPSWRTLIREAAITAALEELQRSSDDSSL
ncbi:hypothetical protein ILYODFUR_029226 [Ilyodon furcidens]|uniref:Uncharacterized protein n=1 Tax=Ilyodon furcidens TaxID=33524 RepID=A0ABV0TCC3_9TELE